MSKVQIRGNCQCCGRQQAVVRGDIAQHGYTVDNGYFNGVCAGHRYSPLQLKRDKADLVVAECRKDAVDALAHAEELQLGQRVPTLVRNPSCMPNAPKMVQYADLNQWQQADALKSLVWGLRNRAKMASEFADQLEGLANRLHGTALLEVAPPAKPTPINSGDQKLGGQGTVLTVVGLERGRVIFRTPDGRKGWMGSQGWRRLDAVLSPAVGG